jgi:hypothetical protein
MPYRPTPDNAINTCCSSFEQARRLQMLWAKKSPHKRRAEIYIKGGDIEETTEV